MHSGSKLQARGKQGLAGQIAPGTPETAHRCRLHPSVMIQSHSKRFSLKKLYEWRKIKLKLETHSFNYVKRTAYYTLITSSSLEIISNGANSLVLVLFFAAIIE